MDLLFVPYSYVKRFSCICWAPNGIWYQTVWEIMRDWGSSYQVTLRAFCCSSCFAWNASSFAWRNVDKWFVFTRPGDKPLSELTMVILLTHMRVTRPQWVKIIRRTIPHRLRNIDQSQKSHNTHILYPTIHHSEENMAWSYLTYKTKI